jgi:hypothetical protein
MLVALASGETSGDSAAVGDHDEPIAIATAAASFEAKRIISRD